ncbi:MAG TPA: CarD family transcriptional regulator [Alphaproteobacteria bacterium]
MTVLKKKKVAAKTVKKPVAKAKATAKTSKKAPAKKIIVKKPVKTVKKAPVKAAKPVKKPVAVKKVAVAAKKAPVKATVTPMKPVAKAPVQTRTIQPTLRTAPTMNRSVPQMGRPGMPVRPVVARPANDTPVDFRTGDYVVYPAHGVGTIEGVETQSIAGMSVTLYAISFEKDRMRLKIPVQKAQTAGLRKLSTGDRLKDALKTLTGKAKIKRTMWSRRAQEYEAKINSGDPVQIAEVLRDLRRPKDDTEQSYSERQIYQSALERLAREVAAVERIAEDKAVARLEDVLTKAA